MIIIMVIVITFVIYLAAGMSTGDWSLPLNMWLRFVLIAIIATFLIPILQGIAGWAGASDLALMIAFIIILLMMRYFVMPELTVADEWMAGIFASFLVVFLLYAIEKIAEAVFHVEMFSFI